MTAESFEYAIKKDVRNNPIVREVDEARQRELWKSVGVAGVPRAGPAVLRLAALRAAAPRLPARRDAAAERAAEEEISRQLRLEIETLRSPEAHRERWRPSSCTWSRRPGDEAIVIERVMPRRAAGASRSSRAGERRRAHRGHPPTWRLTLERRVTVVAGVPGRCGSVGIEARLVYLQVVRHADLDGARRAAADAHA